MPRLIGTQVVHVAGWTGGLRENAEPDTVSERGIGYLSDGLNHVSQPGGRLSVRGGSAVHLTFSAIGGQAITDVLDLFDFSPTGAIAIAHSSGNSKHYAYALTNAIAYALPTGTPTETGSRVDMTWNTAAAHRPVAVELFEKLYVVDATNTSRQGMCCLEVSAGALVASIPTFDLDASGGSPGSIKAYTIAAYNGVLFVAGYDSEATANLAPHMLRHSFLGRDPSSATGWDPDAYNIIGALNQPITALSPGNSILLVAKERELYRVSGQGKAVAGWQYALTQLDNTLGTGCTNPYALAHVHGYWYGIGRGGPWQSDGSTVESLLPSRDRSWSYVANLELAVVRHHPQRRRVLFGFHVLGQSSYATAPFVWWKWDLDRETWDVSDRYKRSFHAVRAIATTAVAPSDLPNTLAQVYDYGEFDFNSMSATFISADATAQTEVWARLVNESSVLWQTVAAGVTRFQLQVNLQIQEPLYVKLRHKKGAVVTDFTDEVALYPRLKYTQFHVNLHDVPQRKVEVISTVNSGNVYLTTQAATYSKTYTNIPASTQTDYDPYVAAASLYKARQENTDWPVTRQLSPFQEFSMAANAPGAPEPRQELDAIAATQMFITWSPSRYSRTFVLEYRLSGGGAYTTIETVTTFAYAGQPLANRRVLLTGLSPASVYEVRVRNTTDSETGTAVNMYTALTPPDLTVVQGGAGTPDVDLQVTVPAECAGKTLRLFNADQTYNQEFSGISAGLTTYNSTAGSCGRRDKYYARIYDAAWPDGYQYSDPTDSGAYGEIASPCA